MKKILRKSNVLILALLLCACVFFTGCGNGGSGLKGEEITETQYAAAGQAFKDAYENPENGITFDMDMSMTMTGLGTSKIKMKMSLKGDDMYTNMVMSASGYNMTMQMYLEGSGAVYMKMSGEGVNMDWMRIDGIPGMEESLELLQSARADLDDSIDTLDKATDEVFEAYTYRNGRYYLKDEYKAELMETGFDTFDCYIVFKNEKLTGMVMNMSGSGQSMSVTMKITYSANIAPPANYTDMT